MKCMTGVWEWGPMVGAVCLWRGVGGVGSAFGGTPRGRGRCEGAMGKGLGGTRAGGWEDLRPFPEPAAVTTAATAGDHAVVAWDGPASRAVFVV